MSLLVFDIGGQGVKYAIWQNNELIEKSSFKTPDNWESLQEELFNVYEQLKNKAEITGVAFSCPGSVDNKAGVINGISAVPYVHGFKIVEAWEKLFNLPVTMENDANAAALAELGYGVAKNYQNVAFMIIGSGIGGAVAINGELVKGRHLFAGEFGYMLMDDTNTLSNLASSLLQITCYNEKNLEDRIENGLELFNLAENGHTEAQAIVDNIYNSLARGIYNLSLVIDPELIAIGGGISVREDIVDQLTKRTKLLLEEQGASEIKPNIQVCHFFNDANLIGAAVNFERTITL